MRIFMMGMLVSLSLVGVGSATRADEQKVPLKDLPKAVVDAVRVRFPEAVLKDSAKETDGGKSTYEVALKYKGKDVDVALTPDGKLVEIETVIGSKDLPKAVLSAIGAKYPKATMEKAEEIIEFGGGKEFKSYEVLLATGEKKFIEVKYSAEGKVLKTAEEDEAD
jgi:uncharacterized membrane protein YkoI